tara:strand:- start:1994 stop:2674 length:681 start_codon:yes stop_codon:yes gene_type:complete
MAVGTAALGATAAATAPLAPGIAATTAAGTAGTALGTGALAALAANPVTLPVLAALAIGKSFIPSKSERMYRRQVKDLGRKLARNEAGLSQREKQIAQTEGAQQVESAAAQEQARLARGSAGGAGMTGARQKAIRDLSKSKIQARGQIQSAITKQDLALRDAMLQQYRTGQLDAAKLSQARAQAAGQTAQRFAAPLFQSQVQQGMRARQELATGAEQAQQQLTQDF